MSKRGFEWLDSMKNNVCYVGDGGFGTYVLTKGFEPQDCPENLNLVAPSVVRGIHQEYLQSGAQVLETNSFCANHHKLKRYGLEQKVAEIARGAAWLAVAAAKEAKNAIVLGALGPLVKKKRELDEYSESDQLEMYRVPMEALIEGGVDALLLETFSRLSDLEVALKVAKTLDVPVLAQMSFGGDGGTEAGVSIEKAFKKLTELGADMVGANCRVGPQQSRKVLKLLSKITDEPLSVYPNAGFATQVDERYTYQASPEYFGSHVEDFVNLGVRLFGGCCGTTPEHIAAIAKKMKGVKAQKRSVRVFEITQSKSIEVDAKTIQNDFHEKLLNADRFVTVEVEPPRDLKFQSILSGIKAIAHAGCDAFNIPDNPLAVVRSDNVIFADLLKQHVELPIVLHLTCRDKNIIALQSDILGAQMVGIESILAVTGDPAAIGDQPGASSVFDVNSIGLVEMITHMNKGLTKEGVEGYAKTNLCIGVGLNPNSAGEKGLEGALMKLQKKIKAGAQYVQTQPMYDLDLVDRLIQGTASIQLPICLGIMPVVSQRNAEFLHNEVPGMKIPQSIRDRFKGLVGRAQNESMGFEIAKEICEAALKKGVKHFYLVTPFEKFERMAELVEWIKRKKV